MDEKTPNYELSARGQAKIQAVDGYLERAIRDGHPIEALIATKRLGEVVAARAKEAARAATEGTWTWTDVGRALGVTKQAAHEKLRARVHDKIESRLSKLERAEKAKQAKIARAARRARERLDQHAEFIPKVESTRQRVDEWERSQQERLGRDMRKAREQLARAEQKAQEKLDQN